jgi:hypothetical protein
LNTIALAARAAPVTGQFLASGSIVLDIHQSIACAFEWAAGEIISLGRVLKFLFTRAEPDM